MAELAGIGLHKDRKLDGISLKDVLLGQGTLSNRHLFWGYVGTARELLKQTGDRKLLEEMYQGMKQIHAAYRRRDTSGDFWPEGMTFPGTSERVKDKVGEPYQMVSAAVRMWWATKAMSEMANKLGLTQDADEYKRLATQQNVM